MNETLAQHYGTPGIKGSRFKGVPHPSNNRANMDKFALINATAPASWKFELT